MRERDTSARGRVGDDAWRRLAGDEKEFHDQMDRVYELGTERSAASVN